MVSTIKFTMIVLVLALVGCGSKAEAERGARKWATSMGFQVQNVSCVDIDTDHDGYVSCSVSVKRQDGSLDLMAIECAANFTMNEGCRAPKINLGKRH